MMNNLLHIPKTPAAHRERKTVTERERERDGKVDDEREAAWTDMEGEDKREREKVRDG